MTALRDLSTMYASMFSFVLFYILFESRFPKKKTVALTFSLIVPLLLINFALLVVLGPTAMGTLLLLTCSLPSLVFFWILAKYRDGRFFFTFCFADTIMLELMNITAIADFFLGNTYIFTVVSRFVLCPIIAFIFWKWVRPDYFELQEKVKKGWGTFAAIALLFYILISVAMSVPTQITNRLEELPAFLLILVLLPFIYIHIFTTLHHQQKAYEAAEKESILSVQVTSLLSRIEEFSAANELLRKERHDFRHKMRTVSALVENEEYEKLKSLAEEYAESVSKKSPESYSKHTLLDAVLSSYIQEAKRKEIKVSAKMIFPEVLPVNESEIANVFANAIENAIHACEKIEPQKRYMEIKVISDPCFMFQIQNSFDGAITFGEDGIPLSPEKEHGFGTRSIATFCEKNNAFCEFKTREQDFIIKVIFN